MTSRPFGRYELLRKVAAGGMAEVYLARLRGQAGFVRDVAVKRMFPHLAEHAPTLELFQYEALLLAELNHPNIPYVFDLGWAEGTWYLAMEYIDGYSVTDLWRAGQRAGLPMPLSVALGVVLQACEGLHHAHERCDRAGRHLAIVHRDVTPHNLMVTRDGVVKVLDFGVARTAARRGTEAGVLRGTLSYMAPEQVRGRPVDRRADVFALGVVLYELTTGSRLFRGTDVQVMTAIVEQDVPPPSSRWAEYPPALEAIVLDALRRDPGARIQSAAELARRLEQFALLEDVPVGPRTLAEYMQAVFPAQPILDESLALVSDPTDEAIEVSDADLLDLPAEAYADVLDGLDDLAPPPGPAASTDLPSDEHVPLVRRRPPTGEVPLQRPEAPAAGSDYLDALERRLRGEDSE